MSLDFWLEMELDTGAPEPHKKDFVPFVEEILGACKEYPKANVRTWI